MVATCCCTSSVFCHYFLYYVSKLAPVLSFKSSDLKSHIGHSPYRLIGPMGALAE